MRRFNITIVIALSTLLLVSIGLTQQVPDRPQPNGPFIGGDGISNYISFWATPNYLSSSTIYQDASKNIGVGTTTPAAKLDVNGGISTATTYGVGGRPVLSIGSPGDYNLFLGVGAGTSNYAGLGQANVFSGPNAGFSNTTGWSNTFVGSGAGGLSTYGYGNVYVGDFAGYYNGQDRSLQTGYNNIYVGHCAGHNTIGHDNVVIVPGNCEDQASRYYDDNSIFIGYGTSGKTYIGGIWGKEYEGISGYDVLAVFTTSDGHLGVHHPNIIPNVYGHNVGGVPVIISQDGTLGAPSSSLRFKEQVRDMGNSSSALMKLRPVTFLYKPEYDKGERTLQYGLIAEEVAKVYPELVAYDNDGRPEAVRYQFLTTMLLNELQKEQRKVEELKGELQVQQVELRKQNDELQQRLMRVETLLQSQVESTITHTASIVSLQTEGTQK